ncbi:tRNA 2-thiouridine(34) synthase MnmA [Thiovibrio sp. JS02]
MPTEECLPREDLAGRKIAVAMSGGVDSSLTAALLMEQGAEVQGVFMALSQPDLVAQIARVRAVADFLGIPLAVLDLAETFRREVLAYFADSYFAGKTPNPCVVCNRTVKFGRLLAHARLGLGADLLATGHYARICGRPATGFHLKKGVDAKKDQSYFLACLSQEQLGQLIFPLGGHEKTEVYNLAAQHGFVFQPGEESQDVCFLKDIPVGDFLAGFLSSPSRPGEIVSVAGRVLGRHRGIQYYTVGQRRGLGIPDQTPYYVIALDHARNRVIVGKDADLWADRLFLREVSWLAGSPPQLPKTYAVKIRYRHQGALAEVSRRIGGGVQVLFTEPQRAITPGQFAVFYQGDEVVGAGEIVAPA